MMRRGQASTWAEYGEDMGVLAGDALMIYAFEVAAKAFKEVSDADDLKRVGRAIEILASKTGIYGMIGRTDSRRRTGWRTDPEGINWTLSTA